LIRKNSYTKDPLSQVLYQRMIPVWKNEKISYLICSVESVAYKKNGFYLHYKNSLTYEKYEPAVGSWSTHTMSLLNERERILLNLSRQGLNSNEISETLCRSKHTIQNQIKALFVKLNVHSIQEAIERANHCNLLHPYKEKKIDFPNETIHSSPKKINKKLMCEIQILLDKGKSIRSIASMVDIAESTIRSWIIKKLLRR
jgi:DNA-binding NarL/FixJ family response regulator